MIETGNNQAWPGWTVTQTVGASGDGPVYEIRENATGEKASLKVLSIPNSLDELRAALGNNVSPAEAAAKCDQIVQALSQGYSMMPQMSVCPSIIRCDGAQYYRHADNIGWDMVVKTEHLIPVTSLPQEHFTQEECVKLAKDAAAGLSFLNSNGALHGDVRPQNLFLADDGTYKLGEPAFVKAAANLTGPQAASVWYMAPETALGGQSDARSDLYSLGVTLYWLLNGRRLPFLPLPPAVPTAEDFENARQRRFAGEPFPAPANGSDALKDFVLRACAFDPQARYADASEMLKGLEALSAPEPQPAAVSAPAVPSYAPAEPQQPAYAPTPAPAPASYAPAEPQQPAYVPVQAPAYPAYDPSQGSQQPAYVPSQAPAGPTYAPAGPQQPAYAPSYPPYAPSQPVTYPAYDPSQGPRQPDSVVPNGKVGKKKKEKKKKDKMPTGRKSGKGLKIAALLLIVAGLAALGVAFGIPGVKYLKAGKLMKNGDFDQAIALYTELDGFLGSEKKIQECEYGKADALLQSGQYDRAYKAFAALDGLNDSAMKMAECEIGLIRTAKEGSTVFFGSYEQDNVSSNGKERIEWIVIAQKEGKALLVSRDVLDCLQYHPEEVAVTWDKCQLRGWLNGEFLRSAFTTEEQTKIPVTDVGAAKNPEHNPEAGADTQDKVFLLSAKELLKFFTDGTRSCFPTAYAVAHGCKLSADGKCLQWTRTPGKPGSKAVFVRTEGSMNYNGTNVFNEEIGVRPAIWVNTGN